MSPASLPRACPLCEAPADPTANFCSGCGARLAQSGPGPAAPRPKWYYNVWFVLCMLLFVLGPFALPLVWKNPRFSQKVKLILTLCMLGYTALVIVMVARMVQTIQASIDAFNATLQF